MQKADDGFEALELNDLGDAMVETKQMTPWPPYYLDNIYGFGTRPNMVDGV